MITPALAAVLTDRLRTPDGGFSWYPKTGAHVTDGFAVSTRPDATVVLHVAGVYPETLVSYLNERVEDFDQDPDLVFGGWHDPDTGYVHLDLSRRVDTADEAERTAREHDQLAYFDFARGVSVPVGGDE